MKIGIVVHGRFHAFDLARELIRAGHDVWLISNYPKSITEKFGIPPKFVRNNLLHGIVSRAAQKLDRVLRRQLSEPFTHRWFGRWAAKVVACGSFDVVHGFSGVFEETLRAKKNDALKTLVRGSAHIEAQYDLLAEEEVRTGSKLDKPSKWIRARERREYELADLIFVLSTFAWKSFAERGVDTSKLRLLPLGAQLAQFRPSAEIIKRRCLRIRDGQPLRVLTVGSFSMQKGAYDLATISKTLHRRCNFRWVGALAPDATRLHNQIRALVEFKHKVPQLNLPAEYQWADIFLFPTLQDGFAVVLAQAAAAGLPILATTNCAAPDMIEQGVKGWALPIRRPELFIERIRWCNEHREELATMAEEAYWHSASRDWSDVARDFVSICEQERTQLIQGPNVARV